MKKLLSLVLCLLLALAPGASLAEFDLSGMSLADLLKLQQQVTLAMWESSEWQEVEVPAGIYMVGRDIPAGHWTISGSDFAYVTWGSKLDQYGATIDYDDTISDAYLESGDIESVSWNLTDGTYLMIEYCSVVFTPYSGANLGFKF